MLDSNLLLLKPKEFCSNDVTKGFLITNEGHAVGYVVLQQC